MASATITQSKPLAAKRPDLSLFFVVGLTVTFWASAFAGIRAGLRSYTPENVALLRYLVASGALALYAMVIKMPLPEWRDVPGIALTGFLGFAFYNVALNFGEQKIPAGTASLIVASAPIFVALLAGRFFQEKLKVSAWIGIGLSFIGVAVISLEHKGGFQLSLSALIVLAAALAQSIYTVSQKPYLKKYTPLQFTAYAIWAGTLFLLVFTPGLVRQMQTATLQSTLAVVYMGIFPGAIGYTCWSYVLSRLPASRAGSFLYLIPAVAILIAWLWLGEFPDLFALFGGLLILAGVVLVNVISRKNK
jgi:drug/metabolite transporter (DMT)-like permease